MNPNDDREMAGRAVFGKWLSDEVRGLVSVAREQLEPRLEPGERMRAQLPDGTVIGAVTIGKPSETPAVTDERALLAWVKENAPTEIVESVNPAFVEVLKRQAKAHGFAHTEDGTVIPGVELRTGSASYRPTLDKDAVPLLRSKLAELIADGFHLALPASESERKAS